MAGSYKHVTKDDGNFRADVKDFGGMIKNLGDAYEACEEMYFMISFLARGNRRRIEEAREAFVLARHEDRYFGKTENQQAFIEAIVAKLGEKK